MKPEVTVIITTYKRPVEILMRAVQSVLNQTFSKFELLIIDDSPDDYEKREEIKRVVLGIGDERIRYIQQEKNMGACVARNRGIEEAVGAYICFLDDDDEYASEKLEKQYNAICHMNVGMVSCKTDVVNDTTDKRKHSKKKIFNGMVYEKMIRENFIPLSAPLLKKECFEQCGLFKKEMPASQDIEMWLRITQKYPVYVLDEVLYIQHIHKGERLTTNPEKKIKGIQKVVEYNMDYLKEHAVIHSIFLFRQVKYYIWMGKKKSARECFKRAMYLYPWNIVKYLPYTLFWMLKYRKKQE